jgi:hypothetical protein
MKNKLLLFFITIALCMAIQLKMNFASENQSWSDYFRSKWAELTSSRRVKLLQEKAPLITAIGLTAKLGSYAGVIPTGYIKWLGISFPITLVIVTLVYNIDSIISYYRTGSFSRTDAIIKIKDNLAQAISNVTLYPTRSSKLHALLKKDEFTQYITDEYGLVQEACAELSREISSVPYSEDQRIADRKIDEKMAKFRNTIINQYTTIDDQIVALETLKQNDLDIPAMQAYLSIYFRLKNKQNVENKLSPEEKTLKQSWTKEAEKLRVSEPEVD